MGFDISNLFGSGPSRSDLQSQLRERELQLRREQERNRLLRAPAQQTSEVLDRAQGVAAIQDARERGSLAATLDATDRLNAPGGVLDRKNQRTLALNKGVIDANADGNIRVGDARTQNQLAIYNAMQGGEMAKLGKMFGEGSAMDSLARYDTATMQNRMALLDQVYKQENSFGAKDLLGLLAPLAALFI